MIPERAWPRVARYLALVLCAAAAGCGGGGGGQGECTRGDRDPEALREQATCVQDGDCPCGGHCDLGICAFECLSNGECESDERCDVRGRCRPSSDSSNLAPPPATAIGRVQAVNPLIGIDDSSAPRRVDFRVLDRPVARMRAVAQAGVEVSCSGAEGPFEAHCLLTDVDPGRHDLFVAPDPDAMAEQSHFDVSLHTAVERVSFGVQRTGTSEPVRQAKDAHVGAQVGSYEGMARLEGLGVEQDGMPIVGELSATAPLAARVHRPGPEEAYIIEIDDPLHLLGADDRWLLQASSLEGGDSWEVTAPLRPYLGGEASSDLEVHARPVVEDLRFDEVLAIDVRLELEGAHGGGGVALAEWRLRLRRTEELPSDAEPPELPAPVVSGDRTEREQAVADRANAPLPWETAVHDALSDPFSVDVLARGATLGDPPSLWQCETDGVSSAEAICRGYWEDKAPTLDPCSKAEHAERLADGEVVCESDGLGDCAEMAAQLGCTITGSYCDLQPPQRAQSFEQPDRSQSCPQLYACWQPPETPDGADLGQLSAPLLDADATSASFATLGDLPCETGARFFAPGLAVNADRAVEERLNARAMLDVCAEDLERHQEGPPSATAEHAQALAELTGTAGCFEPWRVESALAHALAIERTRALGGSDAADGVANSLGMRLSYQWAQVLGLVAREALNSETLTTILSVDDAPVESNPRSLDEYVDLSLRGWDLVLHPRIASGLLAIPGATLADPDYREFLADSPLGETSPVHHQQGIGLPVVFAESLSSQLDAARQLVRRTRFTGTGQEAAAARARRAIGYAIAVLSVSEALALRAMPHSPPWESRWRGARGLARGSLAGLLRETAAMLRGDNPLGIDDGDLPLYFFGDEETASQRFSAISDFLIGSSPSMRSQAWAPGAVERATASLEDARAEWVALRERELAETIDATEGSRRIAGSERAFGKRILSFCGNPDWSEQTILDEWTGSEQYTPSTCYIADTPECSSLRSSGPDSDAALGDAIDEIAEADAQLALCVAQGLRAANAEVRHPDAGAGINDAVELGTVNSIDLQRSGLMRTATMDGVTFPLVQLYELEYGFAPLDVLTDVTESCASRYSEGNPVLPRPSDAEAGTPDPNCFSGSLGDARLAITNARQELEIARTELAEIEEANDLAMEHCRDLETNLDILNQLDDTRDAVVGALRAVKLAADITALTADTALQIDKGFGAIADTPAGIVKIGAGSASLVAELGIDSIVDIYNNGVAEIERTNELNACVADARQQLVGADSATLRIEQAALDLDSAMADFALMQDTLQRVVDDGRAVTESEQARIDTVEAARAPLSNERWVSEKVEQFRREQRLAQRLVYLAVRAVEYEFQMSLPEQGRTLAALHPAELRAVLDDLLATAGTRRLDGKSPTELVTVVSLKDDLLADASFDEHAVSDDGEYAGVRVPFRLIPSSFDGAGEGVEVFTDGDCAERLWSVNASIVGKDGEDVWIGDDPSSFVRMDLRKSNTFFSQWCGGGTDESPFQVASVRPGVNLFVDPGLGRPDGVEDSTTSPDETFTTARIRAFTDVPRTELETDAYMEGETAELAARGLYGDYELVIPANVLSREGSDGLLLDSVDDILIRLEYVSVAR